MAIEFEALYSVDECANWFKLNADDIEDDMDDMDLRDLFERKMASHFEINVVPNESNVNEFVRWGRVVLKSRGIENG